MQHRPDGNRTHHASLAPATRALLALPTPARLDINAWISLLEATSTVANHRRHRAE